VFIINPMENPLAVGIFTSETTGVEYYFLANNVIAKAEATKP
jgi:hypothetical protein